MILCVALLMFHCYLSLNGAGAENTALERIEKCTTRCSQGLHCRPKPDNLFSPPCQNTPKGLNASTVFLNVSLSTVMSCTGKQKCSLHLRVKTVLQLTEHFHGVSVCTASAGMMGNCQTIGFTRPSRQRMSGQQVHVENDCADVSPNQQVQVTVKTVPNYCDITWKGTYDAPGCISEDLRRHVPECITGRLSYDVDKERKELSISVSDMLEDHNYYLRLCRKDFICVGTGASKLIKKEEPVKSTTLSYTRPLPCLCIEGWSAMVDAPRVQVCPFKDRLEELWDGVNFDPMEQTLSWEPSCPVTAIVSLCYKGENNICVALPHASQNVSREKVRVTMKSKVGLILSQWCTGVRPEVQEVIRVMVTGGIYTIIFAKVDPHPQLCIKFTAASQSWTRCPFAEGRFQAWEVVVRRHKGHEEVKVLAQTTASFSVGLCVKSAGSAKCQIKEKHTVHVEKNKAVGLNLTEELLNTCLQVKRLDVNYAVPVVYCLEKCNESSCRRANIASQASWDLTWVVVPAGVCLSGIIIVTLVLHVLLTVYQRRKQKTHGSEKQIDPAFDCVVPALQTQIGLHGGILIPDSPQCGNPEKANLISD